MSKDKIAWSEIFKKNTYYEQKDKMQNIFSIRCIIIIFLLYSFTFFLNLIGVFIVDTQIFVTSYVEMIVALLIYLAGYKVSEHYGHCCYGHDFGKCTHLSYGDNCCDSDYFFKYVRR